MQPPSGGCVLKQVITNFRCMWWVAAAFGRLCVETAISRFDWPFTPRQPPSGGCVLKLPVEVQ